MAAAFEPTAFEPTAFEVTVPLAGGAFEGSAFENTAFYVQHSARGATFSTVLFLEPEDGAQVTYSWATEIRESRNGKETRFSLRDAPHESYTFPFTLSDSDIALLQGQLIKAAATGSVFGVALQHESILVTAASSGSTLTVSSTAYSDWCYAGQTVAVQGIDGTLAGTGVIQQVAANSLTLDGNVTVTAGARVMPTVPCYLDGSQSLSLYIVNAAGYQLKARATYWGNAGGQWTTAGASVATYTDSLGVTYPVWDRGLDTDRSLPHSIAPGTAITDFGGVLLLTAPLPVSGIPRRIDYSFNTPADRQYLKAFHGATKGQQCVFLLPTWRPDFVPVGDASAGTLKIKSQSGGGTDYAGGWFPHPGLRHVQLVLADGSVHYRTVTDATDNLDGTQTLQLDSALAGTLSMASIAATCRLASDDIVVKYSAGGVGKASIPVLVVQQ